MLIIINKHRFSIILICLIVVSTIFLFSNRLINLKNNSVKYPTNNQLDYLILVQIEEKTLFLFEDGKCIKQYPISTGMTNLPSPIGQWKIISKGIWGEGFGGRWLGLDVKWGTYGIHGTTKSTSIGRAASHGCIRMYNHDIKELYDIVPIGTPVIIKNGPYGPFGTGFRELIPGDRGADVLAVQKKLKELGYYNGNEDGIYADDLKIALYEFQKDNNLRVKYTITQTDYNALGFFEFE